MSTIHQQLRRTVVSLVVGAFLAGVMCTLIALTLAARDHQPAAEIPAPAAKSEPPIGGVLEVSFNADLVVTGCTFTIRDNGRTRSVPC